MNEKVGKFRLQNRGVFQQLGSSTFFHIIDVREIVNVYQVGLANGPSLDLAFSLFWRKTRRVTLSVRFGFVLFKFCSLDNEFCTTITHLQVLIQDCDSYLCLEEICSEFARLCSLSRLTCLVFRWRFRHSYFWIYFPRLSGLFWLKRGNPEAAFVTACFNRKCVIVNLRQYAINTEGDRHIRLEIHSIRPYFMVLCY